MSVFQKAAELVGTLRPNRADRVTTYFQAAKAHARNSRSLANGVFDNNQEHKESEYVLWRALEKKYPEIYNAFKKILDVNDAALVARDDEYEGIRPGALISNDGKSVNFSLNLRTKHGWVDTSANLSDKGVKVLGRLFSFNQQTQASAEIAGRAMKEGLIDRISIGISRLTGEEEFMFIAGRNFDTAARVQPINVKPAPAPK